MQMLIKFTKTAEPGVLELYCGPLSIKVKINGNTCLEEKKGEAKKKKKKSGKKEHVL